MKRGGNSNKTNLLYVCCVVIAAALFFMNTMRIPETDGSGKEPMESWDSPSENLTGTSDAVLTDEGDGTGGQSGESWESIPESAAVILEDTQSAQWAETPQIQLYSFRNQRLLDQHYEKHGIEMGFATIEEYVAAANAVINHPDVLHKQEAEDNDDVYFLEATNEFVVVSTDGYIRTYFIASGGIDYYNRQ